MCVRMHRRIHHHLIMQTHLGIKRVVAGRVSVADAVEQPLHVEGGNRQTGPWRAVYRGRQRDSGGALHLGTDHRDDATQQHHQDADQQDDSPARQPHPSVGGVAVCSLTDCTITAKLSRFQPLLTPGVPRLCFSIPGRITATTGMRRILSASPWTTWSVLRKQLSARALSSSSSSSVAAPLPSSTTVVVGSADGMVALGQRLGTALRSLGGVVVTLEG